MTISAFRRAASRCEPARYVAREGTELIGVETLYVVYLDAQRRRQHRRNDALLAVLRQQGDGFTPVVDAHAAVASLPCVQVRGGGCQRKNIG
jgi:hypothetical protein